MTDTNPNQTETIAHWVQLNPEAEMLRVAVCDLNGAMRGKLVPAAQAEKIEKGGLRMPLSGTSVDVWGNDIATSPLVYESGDSDGMLAWTGRPVLPMSWMDRPTGLVLTEMAHEDGSPFPADPRQALKKVLAAYDKAGLTPVVATELEFYLLDPKARPLAPARSLRNGENRPANGVLSLDELDHFEAFFADVYAACIEAGIPAETAISEGGAGQFEVNLLHHPDALRAADEAVLFKRIVKGVASKHGILSSFMPKPFPDRAGSGMHVHFSLLDKDGVNIFDDGDEKGTPALRHAIAGLLDGLPASTLIFAPHLNSYRRLAPQTHAPTTICWGYENRHAAVRVPGGAPAARRIEHRVAGADANPYLVLAAVLGTALEGIKAKNDPSAPLDGDSNLDDTKAIPATWAEAIKAFENGHALESVFAPILRSLYASCKHQELAHFAKQMSELEITTYLETS